MIDNGEAAEIAWQLWFQDLFDRETPRMVEVAGRGLLEGLVELWARHLLEAVLSNGGRGCSRFNLWLPTRATNIQVVGEWPGQVRLRRWIYAKTVTNRPGGGATIDSDLLRAVAAQHLALGYDGAASSALLAEVVSAPDREAFRAYLMGSGGPQFGSREDDAPV